MLPGSVGHTAIIGLCLRVGKLIDWRFPPVPATTTSTALTVRRPRSIVFEI
jgi:hypothetical protein